MKTKSINKKGEIQSNENLLELEIELDDIDTMLISNNKLIIIEGQISQNKEKKWETLLP